MRKILLGLLFALVLCLIVPANVLAAANDPCKNYNVSLNNGTFTVVGTNCQDNSFVTINISDTTNQGGVSCVGQPGWNKGVFTFTWTSSAGFCPLTAGDKYEVFVGPTFSTSISVPSAPVNNGGGANGNASPSITCPSGNSIDTAIGCIPIDNQNNLIGFFLKWGIGIGGGIAFLLILVAGFQIMTSRGDPKRLQAGQELMTSAIAGLLLLIFSVVILRIIGYNILQIPAFNS